jgi:hypothetical protein
MRIQHGRNLVRRRRDHGGQRSPDGTGLPVLGYMGTPIDRRNLTGDLNEEAQPGE